MATARSVTINVLRKGAGWSVTASWLLFILAISAYVTIGTVTAISAFYHPLHEWANYDRAENFLTRLSVFTTLCAALLSSISLMLEWRLAASVVPMAFSIGLLLGGFIYLHSVERGPQIFDRYVGDVHFRIPWQYAPFGSDKPGPTGIFLRMCIDTLLGTYTPACEKAGQHNEQVSVYPLMLGFAGSIEENTWQRHPERFITIGIKSEHQGFAETIQSARGAFTIRYFRLTDADGKLVRSATCRESGNCDNYVRMDRYVLQYTAPEFAFADWKTLDQNLRRLIDSWSIN